MISIQLITIALVLIGLPAISYQQQNNKMITQCNLGVVAADNKCSFALLRNALFPNGNSRFTLRVGPISATQNTARLWPDKKGSPINLEWTTKGEFPNKVVLHSKFGVTRWNWEFCLAHNPLDGFLANCDPNNPNQHYTASQLGTTGYYILKNNVNPNIQFVVLPDANWPPASVLSLLATRSG